MNLNYKAAEMTGAAKASSAARRARLLYELAVEEHGADGSETVAASEALAACEAQVAKLAHAPEAFWKDLAGVMARHGVGRVEARGEA